MTFPHGEVVFRDRAPQIPDPYHPGKTLAGDHDAGTTISIVGAYVAASSSTAFSSATRAQVLSAKSLYCDASADVEIGDRIRTLSGGVWYVNELPTADVNPFTGWQPVREVPLDGTLG